MVEPRPAKPTVQFVDEYCQWYQSLFAQVRSFEAFKQLHLGLLSEAKRKSLPAIATVAGLDNSQSLHHFLTESPWQIENFRQQRLQLILQILQTLDEPEIVLVIDDTGDRKKGHHTDYVKRQYIGNLGKIENGIVAVTAYGVIDSITLPLVFEVYKPKERLKPDDTYRSKPEIAAGMIRKLQAMGFRFKLVLADSLYGESGSSFVDVLYQLKLPFVVAIRTNHALWLPHEQAVRCNRWRKYERVFSNGKTELRYIREIIFGKRRAQQLWELTTDPDTLPKNATWYVMTHIDNLNYRQVGNLYGLRNWVEYGLKQSKNELGWADFRVTNYSQIERWWEMVMSAYLLVSLHTDALHQPPAQSTTPSNARQSAILLRLAQHPDWNQARGWKQTLNNLRLVIQPCVILNLLQPWLNLFPIPRLSAGLECLIAVMNRFPGRLPYHYPQTGFHFSSA
jgi:SRSO17 transposase